MIEYRILVKDDAADLQRLRLEAFHDSPLAFTDTLEDEQARALPWYQRLIANNTVIGAFLDETLVGMSILSTPFPSKQKHRAITWFTYVSPSARGHGIARQIRLTTFEIARKLGIRQTVSGVLAESTAILTLNKSLGCVEFGYEKNAVLHDGKFYDVIHLIKYLDDPTDTQ